MQVRRIGYCAAAIFAMLTVDALATPVQAATKAPEFTHSSQADWLNSKPLQLKQLRGKVVLIEFWAFECVNCRRTHVFRRPGFRSRSGRTLPLLLKFPMPRSRWTGRVQRPRAPSTHPARAFRRTAARAPDGPRAR